MNDESKKRKHFIVLYNVSQKHRILCLFILFRFYLITKNDLVGWELFGCLFRPIHHKKHTTQQQQKKRTLMI